jgi:hypothetical protein
MKRGVLIGLLLLLHGWASLGQEGSAPSFAFEDPVVKITATDGVGGIILLATPGKEPINLTDSGFPKPPNVTFKVDPAANGIGQHGETRWRLSVEVSGLPANTAQKRSATVTMGTSSTVLDYWLTDRAPTLSVATASHWVIRDFLPREASGRCNRIVVYSGDIPGTNLRLLQANVERVETRESIGMDRFQLCGSDRCWNLQSINLEAQKAAPIQLCLDDGFLWPGKYTGTLLLATNQKTDGQSADVTFYVRDRFLCILGFVLIVAGVGGSWFLKARTRPQLNRLQALAPVVYLKMQFAKLGMRLERSALEHRDLLPGTQRSIEFFRDALSEEWLDTRNYLPPIPPAPINTPRVDTEGYARFIAMASSRLDVLAAVMDGVEEVETLGSTASPASSLLKTVLGDLDKISTTDPLPSRDAAQARIREILTTLRTALAAEGEERAALIAAAPVAVSQVYPSYEKIQAKIRHLNAGFWWAWAVLTVVTGFNFLVLKNPLFGTPFDLVTAFIWGFGIPTLLGTVASSSVATALGISVPQI